MYLSNCQGKSGFPLVAWVTADPARRGDHGSNPFSARRWAETESGLPNPCVSGKCPHGWDIQESNKKTFSTPPGKNILFIWLSTNWSKGQSSAVLTAEAIRPQYHSRSQAFFFILNRFVDYNWLKIRKSPVPMPRAQSAWVGHGRFVPKTTDCDNQVSILFLPNPSLLLHLVFHVGCPLERQ